MAKFKNIGIAGLGLIGGSLALEIRKRRLACRVTGFSRSFSTLKKAKASGFIDGYCTDFREGLDDLDLLVVATPIRVMNDYFVGVRERNPELLVTDVASIKETVVRDAEAILGKNSNFVGSHPMAGSERSGIESIRLGLFERRFAVITPSKHTKKKNVTRIKEFWKSLGSVPVILSPVEHDRFVAFTSHLPHAAIFSLIWLVEKAGKHDGRLFDCVGSGFLDTTRIGKSNPQLWTEIFIGNRKNLVSCICEFERMLAAMKKMLREGDYEQLVARLEVLKRTREEMDEKKRSV